MLARGRGEAPLLCDRHEQLHRFEAVHRHYFNFCNDPCRAPAVYRSEARNHAQDMTDHPRTDTSPFHAGELAIQDAAGVRARAAQLGPMFRPAMAEPYRAFFERLPFVLTGSVDSEGQPWASMLIGAPGFI